MSSQESFCSVLRVPNQADLSALAFQFLPDGDYRRILIKPNWVKHQENPKFPIEALVTSSALLERVIEACLEKYKNLEEITVGDVPLQSCVFELLARQAGVDNLAAKYVAYRKPLIRFMDLRRERFRTVSGFQRKSEGGQFGDPRGYREVVLDSSSFLEPICHARDKFAVSDYSQEETTSSHQVGRHRYLICGSALDCDLFINLPKMKTHQKAGITGALKNLVGINAQKAYLVHYRRGRPRQGGDEFPPNVPLPVVLQSRIRTVLQKRVEVAFRILRPFWILLRKLCGIEVEGTRENLGKDFYIAGGSWYGNDTIWRMVYDLNRIIRYAPPQGGKLRETSQRDYIAILDGIVAGEGNGPLQPLPVELKLVMFSNDPFLLDMVMAKTMGLNYEKIPLLEHRSLFVDGYWSAFDPFSVPIWFLDRQVFGIRSVPVLRQFTPAPGWRGHIELSCEEVA